MAGHCGRGIRCWTDWRPHPLLLAHSANSRQILKCAVATGRRTVFSCLFHWPAFTFLVPSCSSYSSLGGREGAKLHRKLPLRPPAVSLLPWPHLLAPTSSARGVASSRAPCELVTPHGLVRSPHLLDVEPQPLAVLHAACAPRRHCCDASQRL